MGEFSPEVKQTVEVLKTAVRAQESGGNPRAISNKGARGLYQITPIAEKDVVLDTGWKNYDIYDPATNEAFYDHYMGKMVARFKDPKLALAAYNMGPTALDRIIAKLGTRDWDVISKYLKNKSSYLETVDYVPSILKNVDFTKA